jgi:hypothetical protein
MLAQAAFRQVGQVGDVIRVDAAALDAETLPMTDLAGHQK